MSSYGDHQYYYSTCDLCALNHYDVTLAQTSVGLTVCGPDNSQSACHYAMSVDSKEHSEGFCWPCSNRQPQSQVPFQGYANYAMGPPQVRFLFQS